MNLSWNEFKEHVDTIMREKDIDPDIEIHYIDITFPEVRIIGVECDGMYCPNINCDNTGISIS